MTTRTQQGEGRCPSPNLYTMDKVCGDTELDTFLSRLSSNPKVKGRLIKAVYRNLATYARYLDKTSPSTYRKVIRFPLDKIFIGLHHPEVQALLPEILKSNDISRCLTYVSDMSYSSNRYILPTYPADQLSVSPLSLNQIVVASQGYNFSKGLKRIYLEGEWETGDSEFTPVDYRHVTFDVADPDQAEFLIEQGYAIMKPLSYLTKGHKTINSIRRSNRLTRLRNAWRGSLVIVRRDKPASEKNLSKLNSLVGVFITS